MTTQRNTEKFKKYMTEIKNSEEYEKYRRLNWQVSDVFSKEDYISLFGVFIINMFRQEMGKLREELQVLKGEDHYMTGSVRWENFSLSDIYEKRSGNWVGAFCSGCGYGGNCRANHGVRVTH
tara:strand:- start:48 stop:413 length:366 start_codon:yes stop_codon:yes gene_type:complete